MSKTNNLSLINMSALKYEDSQKLDFKAKAKSRN
jgi:hypothetical protein